MDIKIDSIVATPTSLRLGCVITGPERSWVRFALVVIDQDALDEETLTGLLAFSVRQLNRYLDSEHADAADVEAPLF